MARRRDFSRLLENLRAQRQHRLDEITGLQLELTDKLERINSLILEIDESIDQVRDILARKRREPKPKGTRKP